MLEALENAKAVHLAQMEKIASEIAGKKIDNPTALGKMECECGVWFYGHQEEMKAILGLQFFERLDKKHEKWHLDYSNIYNIFFKEEKKGFFSKMIGSSKHDMMELDKAQFYYSELKVDTQELLQVADAAIRRVSALSESKFS